MTPHRRLAPLLLACGVLAFVLAAGTAPALARPGGGHGYSGGGDGGGGGGGDGGGELVWFLVRIWIDIVIHYPAFGVPATAAIVVVIVVVRRQQAGRAGERLDVGTLAVSARPLGRSRDLGLLRESDPDFSAVLFLDFASSLLAACHKASGDPKALDGLVPYLSPEARATFAGRPAGVQTVIVASLGAVGIQVGDVVSVELDGELNVSGGAGGPPSLYLMQRATIERPASARSRPPERIRDFGCPKCGAPFASEDGKVCSYCGEATGDGRFDWRIAKVATLRSRTTPPALTGNVVERGTNLPTIRHPLVSRRLEELLADHPGLTEDAIHTRLQAIYDALNDGWSSLELRRARPYVTDTLLDYLRYWTDAYRAAGLRNLLEGFRITQRTIAKVERDRWFDAVTIRFWATGRDATVRADSGKLVSGSRTRERRYSEYWTLVRSRQPTPPARADGPPPEGPSCPNCGASLDVNMAGECAYCKAKVVSGAFDWVLSRIEQDESYRG